MTPGPWLFEGAAADSDARVDDAVAIYQAVAANGDPRGDTAFGVLAARPPMSDEAGAAAAFVRAVDGGDADALVRLGDACWAGQGVPADAPRALDLFERASALGSARGARRGGDLLASGDLDVPDVDRAETCWQRAVLLGREPAALLSLAESTIVREEFVAGVGWAIRAAYRTREMLFEPTGDRRWRADRNDPGGRERLARQLETSMDLVNHHRVEILAAARDGDAEACWHWSRIESLGFGDVPDPVEGGAWLRAAAAAGHAAALHTLAMTERRDGNVEGFETHLRAAAEQGCPAAVHDLAFALYSGEVGGVEDHGAAIDVYRSIAGPGRPTTATDLSFVLEDVPGPDAAEESLHWLRVAAEAGDVAALRRLGERLRDGEGVEPDLAGAAHAFLAAYYLGWDEGIEAVAGFTDSLEVADIVDADRAADGSGFGASMLLTAPARASG